MIGDEAFNFLHEEGVLLGAVLTYVYDLILAGCAEFIERIRAGIADIFMESKIDRDRFRFTGQDIEKYENQIRVTMKADAESMERIKQ